MPPSIFPLGIFVGQKESLTCTHAEEHAPVRVVHLHEPVAGGVNKPVSNKICYTNFPVTIQNERSTHYWKRWGTVLQYIFRRLGFPGKFVPFPIQISQFP